MVEKLAQAALSAAQVAAILDADERTVQRRFATVLKKGRENAHGRLQVKLFQSAMAGNTAAMIFLAKNWLGMRDNPETVVTVNTAAIAAPPAVHPAELKARFAAAKEFFDQHRHELENQPVKQTFPDCNGDGTFDHLGEDVPSV